MDVERKKTKRAIKRWLLWKEEYDRGELTVEEIAKKYPRKDGTPYNRGTIYKAFKRLEELF